MDQFERHCFIVTSAAADTRSERSSLWFYSRGVRRDEWLCCRLWIMTVNALRPSAKLLRQQTYTQNDLMVDPLIVLRCDQRVYR